MMKDTIIEFLLQLETKYNIRILFAIESGSRLWGFASDDSDYDIRFVYIRPMRHYIGLKSYGSDTVNFMDDELKLDFSGWDLKKFCILYNKSNPSAIEWLESDIVYMDKNIINQFLPLNETVRLRPLYEHYRSLAKQNYFKYIKDNHQPVIKKYLYVFRAIINSLLIIDNKEIPPTEFEDALDQISEVWVSDDTKDQIKQLLILKKVGDENMTYDYVITALNQYIETYFEEVDTHRTLLNKLKVPPSNEDRVNDIFLSLLQFE